LSVPDSTTPESTDIVEQPPRPANPVIAQAMSIVMAQLNRASEEAFALLQRASQRANIKMSVLAAHLIEQSSDWPQLDAQAIEDSPSPAPS